jgi:hypothetical protein
MIKEIIASAKKIYDTIQITDIETELKALEFFLAVNETTPLLQECDGKPIDGKVYVYKPSKTLLFLVDYLSKRFNDDIKCLAIFMKIIEFLYQIDKGKPEDSFIIDIAAYTFCQLKFRDKTSS